MPQKSAIVAFLLAFYMHGLTLYFCIAGFVGGNTSVLTAIVQVSAVLLSFLIIAVTKESRRRFLNFSAIDTLYVAFVVLFTYDIFTSPNKHIFPENLAIYAAVYWFAWGVARSLSFDQLKLFCYATTCFASCTCLILVVQVMTGTASFVDNGGRLAAGASGNPILVGYTGAYAFLTGLILWLKSRHSLRWVWLICSVFGLLVNTFSGTRSATLSIIVSTIFIGICVLNVAFQSNKTLSKFLLNSTVIGGALFLLLVFSSFSSSSSTALQTKGASAVGTIDRGISRIDKLFQSTPDNVQDPSIQGREELYQNAWTVFLQEPVWGKGLYAVGGAHNAFLQVAAEFGIVGITAFTAPILLIASQLLNIVLKSFARLRAFPVLAKSGRLLKSDYWMVMSFVIVIFVQALTNYSFHGDPYRSYLPIGSIGIVLSFLRLNHRAAQKVS